MNIHMAKKWPEKIVKRLFIRGHSFRNSLYIGISTVFGKDLVLSGRRRLDDNGSTFSGALKSKSFRDQKEGRS